MLFFTTGCSVDYNIEIKDNQVKVNSKLVETDSSKWDDIIVNDPVEKPDYNIDPTYCQNGKCEVSDGESISSTLTFEQLIDSKTVNADENFKIEGIKKIKTKKELGMSVKNSYNWSDVNNLSRLPGANSCYENFVVFVNKDEETDDNQLIISTSSKNLCFETYNNLEQIKIKLKTNHEVISHNADESTKTTYTWIVDGTNYRNKTIQVVLSEKTFKTINYPLLIGIVSVILIAVAIYLFIKTTSKKANEI